VSFNNIPEYLVQQFADYLANEDFDDAELVNADDEEIVAWLEDTLRMEVFDGMASDNAWAALAIIKGDKDG
jgi:hypothetical protein